MEQKITREELYSLREATHLTSFGLEPGDKEASALADELTSEIINERIAGLQIQGGFLPPDTVTWFFWDFATKKQKFIRYFKATQPQVLQEKTSG